MKRPAALLLCALLGSAASADDADLVARAKAAIGRDLLDPYSARWENVRVKKSIDGRPTVCGEVNAKNAYGAYVGRKIFYYVSDGQYGAAPSGDPLNYMKACDVDAARYMIRARAAEEKAAASEQRRLEQEEKEGLARLQEQQQEEDRAECKRSTTSDTPGFCGDRFRACVPWALRQRGKDRDTSIHWCLRNGVPAGE